MNKPGTYRRKPKLVQAMRYTGENYPALRDFCPDPQVLRIGPMPHYDSPMIVLVKTPEGEVQVSKGSWLVQGSHGEFYPVRNDIFEETFDWVLTTDSGEPYITVPQRPALVGTFPGTKEDADE